MKNVLSQNKTKIFFYSFLDMLHSDLCICNIEVHGLIIHLKYWNVRNNQFTVMTTFHCQQESLNFYFYVAKHFEGIIIQFSACWLLYIVFFQFSLKTKYKVFYMFFWSLLPGFSFLHLYFVFKFPYFNVFLIILIFAVAVWSYAEQIS